MRSWILSTFSLLALVSCAAADPSEVTDETTMTTQQALGSHALARTQRVVIEGDAIGRQKIAYWDTGIEAPPIVLIHSNSCSKRCWERQFASHLPDGTVNALAQDFRLIAFDLPGHGQTVRLGHGNNDYSVAFYAEAVAEFAKALELDHAVYVGHSLGGHALIEAGQLLPNPGGALIYGAPPVFTFAQIGAAFFPMPGGPHFLTETLSVQDIHHWEASVFYDEIPTWFRRVVRRADPKSRSELAASLGELGDEPELVRDYPCPFGIIHGEFERSVRLSYLDSLGLEPDLWRNEIQIVPESNHFTSYDQAGLFNDLVYQMANEVNGP